MFVLLIGTLDTKATETAFVRERLRRAGLAVRVLDAGVLGTPGFEADIKREELFRVAGTSLNKVREMADRGHAVTLASLGAARIAEQLHATGELGGVFGLGGSAGTTIATAAMRVLPYGVPKVMVSTLASGQVSHYVGIRDIAMFHSVVDISGLNRISRTVLGNASAAFAGMVQNRDEVQALANIDLKPLITATMFGVTTPCVEVGRKHLEASGFEVLVFHATGTGGRTMEALIREGMISGVFDATTTELADELVGGILTAGRDRMTAASLRGVPQVISVGAMDMVNFGPRETVPAKFMDRKFHQHNASVTLMRTTPEENDKLGREIAEKASASQGPTAVVLPLRGVSAIDREGQSFWWPEADQALFESIQNWMSPHVKIVELDLHINDAEFAKAMADTLLKLMRR